MNGGIVEGVWSGVNVISLFEPSIEMPKAFQNLTGIEKIELKSPHSSYGCILSSCSSNTNSNIDQGLLKNPSINSN